MLVKVTEERECCQPKDLRNYNGEIPKSLKPFKPKFCFWCGQLWLQEGYFDGIETAYRYRKAEVS